jgi:uncharacterized protein YukE
MGNKIWNAFGGPSQAYAGPIPTPTPGPAPQEPNLEVHPEKLRPIADAADALFGRLQSGTSEVPDASGRGVRELEGFESGPAFRAAASRWEESLARLKRDLGEVAEQIRQTANAYAANEQQVKQNFSGG